MKQQSETSMNIRLWLTTACSTIVSIAALYFGLNHSKFCFKQMRYLTDTEKIQMAFNYHSRCVGWVEQSETQHLQVFEVLGFISQPNLQYYYL
ncbi:hypothetical protein H6G54_10555 [Anabaena cylindrica FACHB-243]|uniref:Uncharacterized protein n=1 Tax=Anabaena cylindrica (strain ATCC 27899 / PCC 7122) TaxID=272123 RepID=K9ZCF6_ANACC|nr:MULTISPECIES: hypothetical protein [Anabaena]AFZ56409.1 hypothetical protein Anacy_0830 [Anabaena cylindrica PCC 7122]MBD2418140.1 hypothetical protein [Anabaena cylindrica FACHB-243]MBY5281986.1 hypothetical protein [Anabaena sp. CCAP 1446/1C]MBY5309258.1 hypothetical protein [Anabaena sp. CCAP 1446/1C]MCM2407419.1 hypothetical protein [Anabaena sp. CCAP 1446/1C]